MIRRLLVISFASLLFLSASAKAEEAWVNAEQSKVSLIASSFSEDEKTLNAGVHFKIDSGWHVYWRQPGDVGLPISFDWSGSENVKDVKVMWPAPKRKIDYGSIENIIYENEVVLPLKVTVDEPGKPVTLKLKTNYAICKDICVYAEASPSLMVPPGYKDADSAALLDKFEKLVPKASGTNGLFIDSMQVENLVDGSQKMKISARSDKGFDNPDIFIEGPQNFRFPKPEKTAGKDPHDITFTVPIDSLISNNKFMGGVINITLVNGNDSVEKSFDIPATDVPTTLFGYKFSNETLLMIIVSILGGLILNIMPCVLPVLSIKLLGVIKHSGSERREIRIGFLASAAGIISSFLLLAAVVMLLKNAGMAVGWGFHFQEPVFLITMILILTIFGADLWGFFEINLPMRISDYFTSLRVSENSLTASFLSGALATVLATPCSAPFVGTAVGFAFSQGAQEIFMIFFFLGLGLSLPYLFIAAFPGAVTKLPHPGAWMVKVKYFLGLLLIITAIWLLYTLSAQLGIKSALILTAIVSILFTIAFIGRHISKYLVALIVAIICVASFTLPFYYAQKKIPEAQFGALWQPFDQKKIAEYVGKGKVVFVDITADWCLTCKANEILVLKQDDVSARIFGPDVIAMRGDWTAGNTEIANYLKMHNRYGIPFNAVYGPGAPEGILLPELLSTDGLLKALDEAKKKPGTN